MNTVPIEHQYVLYAAAIHSSLLDLLANWQPWMPELEWLDMAVHIAALADAITVLTTRGKIELLFGEPEGAVDPVSPEDVPNIVFDMSSWWSPVEGTTPETVLVLTLGTVLVLLPQRRPDASDTQE